MHKSKSISHFAISLVVVILSTFIALSIKNGAVAAQSVNIIFPVIGSVSYFDDFNSPRNNGTHRATDLMGSKMQKIVSASAGTIQNVTTWEGAGNSIRIRGEDGYTYNYYHLNNDRPGTDDGSGGYMNAFAPDVAPGKAVVRGQFLGYLGDSGNAEGTGPHLHFEMYDGNTPINPYSSLRHAQQDGRTISKPADYPQLSGEFLPYGVAAAVPVNIANLKINDDQYYVTAPGEGGGPDIRVFNSNGSSSTRLTKFQAYSDTFRGGVDVATGDIDGDGAYEVVTAAGVGGSPHVKVFTYRDAGYFVKTSEFFAYDKTNRDGVRVAIGDTNGDGKNEIITSPQSGSGPQVKVFTYRDAGYFVKTNEFFAYDTAYRGGVDVTTGYLDADNKSEIITGSGAGMNSEIAIFDQTGKQSNRFDVYSESSTRGVRVSAGDVRSNYGQDEIVTVPLSGGAPSERVFNGVGTVIANNTFAESWWRDGYDVAVFDNGSITSTLGGEKRRASVR